LGFAPTRWWDYNAFHFRVGGAREWTINATKKKVILVEDDPAIRDALQLLLSGAGHDVEEFESGEALRESFEPADFCCAILDMNLPGMSGLDVQKLLKEKTRQIQVVFLTGHGEVPLAVEAMRAGALDFIEKPSTDRDILDVVERACQAYSQCYARRVTEVEAKQRIASLTGREQEVFERVALGRQNKEVARDLEISPRTVEIYRARVMDKLEADNLSELIRVAIAGGHYPGFITGKPVELGGSLGRTEATGYGVMYTVREAFKRMNTPIKGLRASMQGFGNVAQYAAKLFIEMGGIVVAVACWDNQELKAFTFRKAEGVDVDELLSMTDRFGTIDRTKAAAAGYEILDANAWIAQEVEVLVPAALENQVTAETAAKIQPTVQVLVEGANGPTTPEADAIIKEKGIFLIPDFLANAGGVTCSYFEQVQCNTNFFWPREEVLERLDHKMTQAFHAVADLSQEEDVYTRDAAYMIAIQRVATACHLRGWA